MSLDNNELLQIAQGYRNIVVFEEGSTSGGIGEKLAAALMLADWKGTFRCHGISGFVQQAAVNACLTHCGLTVQDICNAVKELHNG